MGSSIGSQNQQSFFASAMRNRLRLLPGATQLAGYGNGTDGATSSAAYNSRVLASQINGAGPVANPINAPYSFADFATGKKSLTTNNGATVAKTNRWTKLGN